jgi:hypothetical protein
MSIVFPFPSINRKDKARLAYAYYHLLFPTRTFVLSPRRRPGLMPPQPLLRLEVL